MRRGCAAPARRADKMARERSPSAERSTANPEIPPARNSVRTPRSRTNPWLQFGEAYSALRGWRPIPAALLSHSVLLCSGTEDISLPTQRLQTSWSRPTQGKFFPDKHRSIGNKSRPVKSFATIVKKTLWKSITWHHSSPCMLRGRSAPTPTPPSRRPYLPRANPHSHAKLPPYC